MEGSDQVKNFRSKLIFGQKRVITESDSIQYSLLLYFPKPAFFQEIIKNTIEQEITTLNYLLN